jgi:ribosome biogenesis GTPase
MAPKYRRGEQGFLDDEAYTQRSSRSGAKKPDSKARRLSLDEANATVAEVFPNQCRIRWDESGEEVLAAYRRSSVLKRGEIRERAPVAVGDRVKAEKAGDTAIVAAICERRNRLLRPAPEREAVVHVIVANVDRLAIVASAAQPEFSEGLVDRILVAALAQGIDPWIVVNKIDLWTPQGSGQSASPPWQVYRELGFQVREVSAKAKLGMDELRESLQGISVAFCGHSGVGKTSVLNALTGGKVGPEGAVSDVTGKGRHTTTSAVLLQGPGEGTVWIDTPGVREFGLADVRPEALKEHFPEFREPKKLGCASDDCSHRTEEGCRARELPRYPSYRRILDSLLIGEG